MYIVLNRIFRFYWIIRQILYDEERFGFMLQKKKKKIVNGKKVIKYFLNV